MNHDHSFLCPACRAYVAGEFDVEPFVQGNLSGPPEQCFPDEGGFAVLTSPDNTCPHCLVQWTEDEITHIEKAAYDAWESAQADDADNPYD